MEAMVATGSALAATGALLQGNAQSASYKAAAQANDYNATVARQNAVVAMDQANQREELQRRKFGELQGQAVAAAAQSGAGMDGSNADVLRQNAINAEMDALTIRYEGQMQARGLQAQADLQQFEGRVNRMNARTARLAGYANAGAALLTGGSKAYGMSGGGAGASLGL